VNAPVRSASRRSRAIVATALALALACALGSSEPARAQAPDAGRAAGVAVSEGSGTVFPGRSLVLSVPGRTSLASSEVHLSENGQAISEPVVTPIANAGVGDFGIVLAIDVSPSMGGRPLQSAMRAARALAERRTGRQELGVVEFDQTPTVVVPLTTSAGAIAAGLRHSPRMGAGTHLYDAMSVALQQLQAAHVAAGAVILLSDGADRGSANSESTVAAAARAAHVSLYTVGVRDGAFDPSSLSMLARDGGGQFLAASSSQLEELFVALQAGLVSRYVVHYRSLQAPGRHVQVRIGVEGAPGTATLSYLTPSPARVGAARPKAKSFWISTLALVAISIGAALLLGFAVVVFLAPRVRRDALRARVGRFTEPRSDTRHDEETAPRAERLAWLERMLSRTRRWARFKEDVEIAQFDRPAVELVAIYAAGTAAATVLLAIAFGSPVLSLVALVLGPLLLHSIVRSRLRKQRQLFATQLPSHLEELASAMRAGHSFVSGLNAVVRTASEPSATEWRRVVADEQLGVPLEAALEPLRRRMDCEDIRQVALVATLQQRSGGNMADVIDRVADGVRERADLRRELESLTAQARLSRGVVTALPPLMVALLAAIRPGYMHPLLYTGGGQLMLGLALAMVVAGSLVMRAITDIKA
jgi:tight adherence protein B